MCRRGWALAVWLVACGTSPQNAAPAPAPAPPTTTIEQRAPRPEPVDAGAPLHDAFDPIVDWIARHDVEHLALDAGGEGRFIVTMRGVSYACLPDACFPLPFASSVRRWADVGLSGVGADPARIESWTVAVSGDGLDATPQTFVRSSHAPSERMPFRARPLRGAAVHSDAISDPDVSAMRASLATLLAAFGSYEEIEVWSAAAGARRVSVIAVQRDEYNGEGVWVVRDGGGAWRSDPVHVLGVVGIGVLADALAPDVDAVVVDSTVDRDSERRLVALHVAGDRVVVYEFGLGGCTSYGEHCENERDGYCVWFDCCERALVVDGPGHAHLGPITGYSALHRRLTDRWSYGTIAESSTACPRPASYCVEGGELAACTP